MVHKPTNSPAVCCGGYTSSCDGRVEMSSENGGSSSDCASDDFVADDGTEMEFNYDAE